MPSIMKNEKENCLSTDQMKDTVTSEDVAIVARRVTKDPKVKVLDYFINSYSKEVLGLLGSHRVLTITVQRKDASKPEKHNLFVKSIPYEHKAQADMMIFEGIFTKELLFYETLIPRLIDGYIGEKWSPTYYLLKKDAIIMEDLRSQGYRLRGRFFDEINPIKSVLATLARFHSCSILAEAELSRRSEHPVTLYEQYPKAYREIQFKKSGLGFSWFTSTVELLVGIGKRLGYNNSAKLREAMEKMFDFVEPSETHRNVICHRDLWMNNIMFDESSPLPKCILVDFQIIRYAPLVLDILQLLYLNSTREFRRKNENELIAFYHSILEITIKSNDPTESLKVPTLEEISFGYEDLRLFGAGIAGLYFPVCLIDSKILTECLKDHHTFEEYCTSDRMDFIINYMEKDEFFKSQLGGVISEIADIAEQL